MKKIKYIFYFLSIVLIGVLSFDFFFGKLIINSNKSSSIIHGNPFENDEKKYRVRHKFYHHTLKSNFIGTGSWGKKKYEICTNKFGFKSSCKNINDKLNYDYVFIGDSLTEGIGLKYEDTFVGMFDSYNNNKIANLGVASYSPSIIFNKLDYFLKMNMKVKEVILFIDISDIQDESCCLQRSIDGALIELPLLSVDNLIIKNEKIKIAKINVKLSEVSTKRISVNYKTVSKTAKTSFDFFDVYGSLTFDPGQKEKSVDIIILDDKVFEGNEQFEFKIFNPKNAAIRKSNAIISILDDEVGPTLNIENKSTNNKHDNIVDINIQLSEPSSKRITVNYSTKNGTAFEEDDYKKSSGILTFQPYETSKKINVSVYKDLTELKKEHFKIILSNAQNAKINKSESTILINNSLERSFELKVKNILANNFPLTINGLRVLKAKILGIKKPLPFYLKYGYEKSAWTYNLNSSGFGEMGVQSAINKANNEMEKIYNLLSMNNIKLSVVVYPWVSQLLYDQENSLQVKIWKKFCEFRCNKFVNLFPDFFKLKSELGVQKVIERYYIEGDVHLNKKGNELFYNKLRTIF